MLLAVCKQTAVGLHFSACPNLPSPPLLLGPVEGVACASDSSTNIRVPGGLASVTSGADQGVGVGGEKKQMSQKTEPALVLHSADMN